MASNKSKSTSKATLPSIDAITDMNVDELRVLEKQYEKEATGQGKASANTMFAYACGLVRSQYKDDRAFGIDLLMQVDKSHPDRHRDCIYFLSIGHYRQEQLSRAKEYIDEFLQIEPNNQQAQGLEGLIKKKMAQGNY